MDLQIETPVIAKLDDLFASPGIPDLQLCKRHLRLSSSGSAERVGKAIKMWCHEAFLGGAIDPIYGISWHQTVWYRLTLLGNGESN
jgi:hypothetical protein